MKGVRDDVLTQIAQTTGSAAVALRRRSLIRLNELKQAFAGVYLNLHARARLGVNDDKKRSELLRDARLAQLQILSAIDLMPVGQLANLQNRLEELKSCFALTKRELSASPICPHCGFRPVQEPQESDVTNVLAQLDDELDRLVADWRRTLLSNLEDPVTRENLSLIQPERRRRVKAFIQSGKFPESLEPEFIEALQEVLSGLVKVVVTTEDLKAALLSGGSPASPAEMKARFARYIDDLAKGQDPAKVRVVVE